MWLCISVETTSAAVSLPAGCVAGTISGGSFSSEVPYQYYGGPYDSYNMNAVETEVSNRCLQLAVQMGVPVNCVGGTHASQDWNSEWGYYELRVEGLLRYATNGTFTPGGTPNTTGWSGALQAGQAHWSAGHAFWCAAYGPSAQCSTQAGTKTYRCTPPVAYSCTGSIPSNASAYDAEESSSLSSAASWAHSSSDTATKCQYRCNTGYAWNGSSCVASTPSCSGSTPCGSPGSCYATYCDGSCTSGAIDYNGSYAGCGTPPAPSCSGSTPCGSPGSCYATYCDGSCTSGATDYNGSVPGCGTAPVITGSISVLGCTIPIGGSSCTTYVSWSTVNVPRPRAAENGSLFSTIVSRSNFARPNKTPGSYTYTISNSSTLLDSETVQVLCATGSTWNGIICEANTPSCTAPNSCGTHPSCYAPACNGVCGGSAIDYNGSAPGCGTPAPCTAQTINNCELQNTSHMNFSGTCTTGYGGDCSYACNNGSWELTSTPGNTCTLLGSPTVTSGTRTVPAGDQATIVTNPQGHTGCYLEGGAFTPITGAIGTVEMSHLVTIDARTTFTIVCDGGVRSAPITIEVVSRVFET